jgi:hypothetical protein
MDQQQKSELLNRIRGAVRERLVKNRTFMSLPLEKRNNIAHDTVKALHYIAAGESGDNVPASVTLAGNVPAAQTGPSGQNKAAAPASNAPAGGKRVEQRKGFGEAAREGSQAFTDTIANVNFPQFVAGLIDGVFNSIVTTSIKQMEAYAEMVSNVSKSVDQYMKDNVSENNARDYLAQKYPDHLEVNLGGDKPKLKPKDGYDEDNMPDFFHDLGLKAPVGSLDEDNVEQDLVPAARRRIAMDRQQLLATMVMMGVNRLVVTNGTIEASCMFELDTTDALRRARTINTTADFARAKTRESGADSSSSTTQKGDWKGQWKADDDNSGSWSGSYQRDDKSNWYTKGTSSETAKFNITTARNDSAEETINMHAQLGGKVKVNFKSDYFPMEKMVDVLQINQIRDKTPAGAPQPAAAPPPMPPMPALPPGAGTPAAAPAPAPAPAAPR